MEHTHSNKGLFVRLIISLCLLGLAAFVFVYRQSLIDTFVVWQFKPTPDIAAISRRTKLTEHGKFYFYASRPQLDGREQFNNACKALATEQTVVLGCYVGMRIYLFDIDNPKLDGIKEVTAAHEMLHAAYDRLSPEEREHVDGLIEDQLRTLSDERILELIKEYDKTEPGQRLNELHSILGTEVAALSPELEKYYTQYFEDRSVVVALADGYSSVFEQLKSRTDVLLAEINTLANSIEQHNATYSSAAAALNADITSFNARANSGKMTKAEFDRERAGLEARQDELQTLYDSIKAEIAAYDAKRAELESINAESDILNRSINSALSPVPNL